MANTRVFFAEKNVGSFCSYSYFFSKNTCESDIVLTRTVNILTTYQLVKLTMLRTTGPWILHKLRNVRMTNMTDNQGESTLVISTSLTSNNRLSQSENLVPVQTRKSNDR